MPETHAVLERDGESDAVVVTELVPAGAEGEGRGEPLGEGEKDMHPTSTTAPAPPAELADPAFAWLKALKKAPRLALTKLLPPPPPVGWLRHPQLPPPPP